MALSIEGATIGIDGSGVSNYVGSLKQNIIIETQQKINTGVTNITESIGDFWQGDSANIYKKNLASDAEKINNALDNAYNALETEIYRAMNAIHQSEKNIIVERNGE